MNYAYNHGSQGNLLNCAPVQTQSKEVDTKSTDEKIGASIRKAG